MAYLNINIPPVECWVRSGFLRDEPDGPHEPLPCIVFGMASIPGRTPLFHFLMEDEGLWWRMPIHAFCHRPDAQLLPLTDLCLWDSFSYNTSCTVFELLAGSRMGYMGHDGEWKWGNYLMTLDWADGGFSETPNQHKCGHIIELDSGNYAIQPNNRCRVFTPFFTTKPYGSAAKRKFNTRIWSAESTGWKLKDDNWNYETTKTDDSNPV
jgi:hypothetical protein